MRGFRNWLALGFLCCSASLAAGEQRFRFQVGHVSSPTELFNSGGVSLGLDSALGARFSFEHLFTEKFGLELGAATSEHEVTLMIVNGVRRETDFRMTPLTLTANLHFGDSDRVDSFFGGGLAYILVGDTVPLGSTDPVSVDPELTWTVQYGMDIALGRKVLFEPLPKKWSLGLSVSYLPTSATASAGRLELPLEALQIYAGMTLRLE